MAITLQLNDAFVKTATSISSGLQNFVPRQQWIKVLMQRVLAVRMQWRNGSYPTDTKRTSEFY